MIKEVFQGLWPDAIIEAKFYPGGTSQMLAALLHLYDTKSDFVLIHVGTNNVHKKDGTPRQDIASVLDSLYSLAVKIRSHFPSSVILFSSILPRVNVNWHNDRIRYINRKFKEFLFHNRMYFIDNCRLFLSRKYKVNKSFYSDDGLHLSLLGKQYLVWAWIICLKLLTAQLRTH